MKISQLAKDTAKRMAENLEHGGHCELFASDSMNMETAIQRVIDHVQSGGFTGEDLGPVLDSQNDQSPDAGATE